MFSVWQQRVKRKTAAGLAVLVLAWYAMLPCAVRANNFTATLDRDMVNVGEPVTLTLTFEGDDPKSISGLTQDPNLRMVQGGASHFINSINGETTQGITKTLEITPLKPGEYTIPALTAEYPDGSVLKSKPLKLVAVKAGNSATNQLAFMKFVLPKTQAYVGEVVEAQLQLYLRDSVANAGEILQGFDQLNNGAVSADGFTVLKIGHLQHRREQVGNAIYNVGTLVASLAPVKSGQLTINSFSAPVTLSIPRSGQRQRDPFDNFGMGFGMFQMVDQRQVTLSADPAQMTAVPLPTENVPADFNGAVGSYQMAVSAGQTNVSAGDPITLKIQITGRGALDSLSLPEQWNWPNFKLYPATTKQAETTDPMGIEGTKTFERVIEPQSANVKEIPPVSFTFFDPAQKTYRTLRDPGIPLEVRPSATVALPAVAAVARPGTDNAPSLDIVPVKQRIGTLAQISPPLLTQTWFIALQGAPLLAWLSLVAWRRRVDSLANNPRLRRKRLVEALIRKGLVDLHRLASENRSEEFFAAVSHLLQEQLGEKLDLPASAITESVIEERLIPSGTPEAVVTGLRDLFQICNLARYAPVKTSQELASVIPKVEAVLEELREVKG